MWRATLHSYRIRRQREADHGDADRRVLSAGIGDQPVSRVHGLQEEHKRGALQIIEQCFVRGELQSLSTCWTFTERDSINGR